MLQPENKSPLQTPEWPCDCEMSPSQEDHWMWSSSMTDSKVYRGPHTDHWFFVIKTNTTIGLNSIEHRQCWVVMKYSWLLNIRRQHMRSQWLPSYVLMPRIGMPWNKISNNCKVHWAAEHYQQHLHSSAWWLITIWSQLKELQDMLSSVHEVSIYPFPIAW